MQRWWAGRHLRPGVGLSVAVLTILALAGCSDEVGDAEEAEPEEVEPADLGTKPELGTVLPEDRGDPPAGLQREDLVDGEGDEAEPGDRLTVHFVGASWASGREFDATWDRGQPFAFVLGVGEVIEGWDQGLVGMREGGRRALVIPPDLAYGDRGAAAGIEPGEAVVFIVDLLEVGDGPGPRPSSEEPLDPDGSEGLDVDGELEGD